MERPQVFLEDRVRQIGEANFDSFRQQAKDSSVPTSFFKVSRELSLDLLPEEPIINIASILFSIPFRSDTDAWIAMKYAEAMSLLKQIDEPDPRVDLKKLDEAIGTAVLVEEESQGAEALVTKQIVEGHFEDPRNVLNFSYFAQNIGKAEN